MFLREFDEGVGNKDRLFFNEEAVGKVADDSVGMSELGHELGRACSIEAGEWLKFFVLGEDAVDPAMGGTFSLMRLHFRSAFFGEPFGVFDHIAIHVDDPEGAVGSGASHDRA